MYEVRLSAGSTTKIDADAIAGTGSSEFNVGSNAPNSGGVLDDIAGPLLLIGGSGQNVITLDDSGSNSARTVTLTGSEVTGLGTGGITYVGMSSLGITLGAGNDSLTVAATDDTSTAINTGAGDDTVTIQSVEGNLSVQGGSGSDTFFVGGTNGTIQPGAGPVALIGGSGGNNRVVASGDVDFTLANWDLGLSNGDSFSLQSIQQAVLTGGVDDNTFDVSGWSGHATVVGGGGNDTLFSFAHGDQTLSDSSLICSTGGTFTLSAVDSAELTAGPSGNILNASDFSGSASLYGGAGDDHLYAGSGNDVLVGGPGSNYLSGGSGTDLLVGGGEFDNTAQMVTLGLDPSGNPVKVSVANFTGIPVESDGLTPTVVATVSAGNVDTIPNTETNPGGQKTIWNENVVGLSGDGNNVLEAGSGIAWLFGDSTSAIVNGAPGSAILSGGSGSAYMDGGAGTDQINGGSGKIIAFGGTGNDILNDGTNPASILYGGTGNERVVRQGTGARLQVRRAGK